MAEVKIRKLPDWVVEYHRYNAKLAGHSLEAELRRVLTDDLAIKKRYWSDRLRKLRAEIKARGGKLSDPTEDIRAERERLG